MPGIENGVFPAIQLDTEQERKMRSTMRAYGMDTEEFGQLMVTHILKFAATDLDFLQSRLNLAVEQARGVLDNGGEQSA